MSILVLLIAALHAIPIVLAGQITKRRKTVTKCAWITALVSIVTGAVVFTILDLIAIWIAWRWTISRLPKSEQGQSAQAQRQSPQGDSGMRPGSPEPKQSRSAFQTGSGFQAKRSSRNALPFGTVLNRVYTVEAELGHGGVGIVYRARHRELGPVAIKEYLPTELVVREGQSVHPVNTDSQGLFEEGMDRFLQEAKQLIRFRMHPSIVSCRDFFRTNGTAYLVMDLEEGMSLSELLHAREAEGCPFDEEDLRTVMVPLLEGLDLVHAAGVLHRDVKPANILIRREDDRPVLIDFGAAKQEFALHSKSIAPFSPGYAAIEQVAEGRLGRWTDMYGIGAVMWRMVAGGNKPFDPPHPVRAEKRAHSKFRGKLDPMPSAQALGKGRFSQRVLAAIDQCLELREADRVRGCRELLQRLR